MTATKKPVVVMTGVSSGIGLAAATLLASDGWRVIGTRRTAGAALPGVDQRIMDVTSDESVSTTIAAVMRDYGAIDAVVNNAGAGHVATLEDDSMDEIRQPFKTPTAPPSLRSRDSWRASHPWHVPPASWSA